MAAAMADDDVDLHSSAPSADLTALKATIDRMQEAALLVQNKHKQTPAASRGAAAAAGDGHGDDHDDDTRAALSVLRKALLKVKALLRSLAHEMQRERDQTESAMGLEDTQALALKNLLYELDHYRRTTRAMENFQTAFPDLEVISLEEFMMQSGEKAPESEAEAQNIEIARLKAERKRREELEEKKSLLLKRKRELTKSRDDEIAFEDSLKVQLRSLRDSALLVQGVFPETKRVRKAVRSDQILLYSKLPTPLYILYTHLMSARDVLNESIELKIKRESKEMVTDNDNEDKPLRFSVVLKVKCPSEKDTATVTLQFRYMEDLDVVTVVSEDVLLKNLFPKDGGLEAPNKAAAKPTALNQMQGEAFKWCQLLAGMDFIPLLPSTSIEDRQSFVLKAGEQGRAQIILQKIRGRFANEKAFEKEIESITAALAKKSTSSSSKKPSMTSFSRREPNRVEDAKFVAENKSYDLSDLKCVCNVEIKMATSRFGARIYVNCDYPEVRPVFRLSVLERPSRGVPPPIESTTDVYVQNEDALGQELIHLEAKVNCTHSEENILTAQLDVLMGSIREVVQTL